MYLVNVGGVVRLLLVLVAVLGYGHEEAVDAQLPVQLQRLVHAVLVLECYSHCGTWKIFIYINILSSWLA